MNLIAVDGMGGDQAPSSIVEGVILAKEEGVNCALVGDKREIEYLINNRASIPLYDYPEVIGMDEEPTRSIRRKKKSSIVGCMNLLKNNEDSRYLLFFLYIGKETVLYNTIDTSLVDVIKKINP